jgi:hypothetical protein
MKVVMPVVKTTKKTIRRSIALAAETDAQVKKLARRQRQSTSRALESLVEAGLAAKEAEKNRFFELAERLRSTRRPSEIRQIKEELARMTFGS